MVLVLVLLLIASAGLTPSGRAQAQLAQPAYSKEHVLVELEPGVGAAAALDVHSEKVLDNWLAVPVPPDRTPEELIEELANRTGVLNAELDYLVVLDPTAPIGVAQAATAQAVNDPYAPLQWHFPAVQAEAAWETSTGAGVTVAVVDTGISQDGDDLNCHTLVAPYNAITQTTGSSAAEDDNGHGTHVAGTIAQCTNNGVGVAGVAFDASLMPVKVLDSSGSGLMSAVANGVEWAHNHGADVVNLSLGCSSCSSTLLNQAIEAAVEDGVVVVAASGNDNSSSVSYPASHPDVIAVGATGLDDTRAPYSNRGNDLDVMAPGGNTSQDLNSDGYVDGVLQETFTPDDGWAYYFFQGTSMATPHVSGAAAILKSIAPGLDADGVRTILEETALDLGPPGFDTQYGNGLIQIAEALDYLDAPDITPPGWGAGAELTAEFVEGDSVRLSWPQAEDDRAVAGYRVYEAGSLLTTVAKTSHVVAGLSSSKPYVFEVRALDLAGNLSGPLSVTVTTPDWEAPSWRPADEVVVQEYGESELTLAWSTPHDDVGVTEYRVGVSGTSGISTSREWVTLSGLQPGGSYVIEVTARDAAGNWSEPLFGPVRTSQAFLDTPGTTFHKDVLWMSGEDITRGCNPPANDLYCPDDSVTRGQLAAFMVRMGGLTGDSHGGFLDVPESSTFASDIGILATAGITRGCNPPVNDLFCPDDPVTRGQLAAFFKRAGQS